MRQSIKKTTSLMIATALFSGNTFAADEVPAVEDSLELSDIQVISTTPLHGVGLPEDMIPTNVQTATAEEIAQSQSLNLSDFMNTTLGSVNINSAQGNPYQPDVQYRGYSASHLLGLPQGMSVYMDGVRLNSPFGDTVSWDTIPTIAIDSINLMPGSNPLFGLNTLGGALSIQSKTGFTHEGSSIQAYTGSWDRSAVELESGGNNGEFSYYVAGNWFDEDGWRDHSESEVKQFFADVGWANESTTLNLSITAADTDLNGNGASPVELVDQDRDAVFTWPDNTQNDMQLFNLRGSHWINNDVLASGNIYYRNSKTDTFNGDGADFDDVGGFLADEDGNLIEDQNGNNIAFADQDAINNRGETDETSGGFGLQFTFLQPLMGHENQFVAGTSYDKGDTDYTSTVEVASLNDDRGTTQTGTFIPDEAVDVNAENRSYSFFFTDTFSVTDALALTLSGRYNNTEIKMKDNLDSTSTINGTNSYKRFNPAVGATYQINQAINTYASYSESSRAPTPSELGCSDPNDPCTLPNAFLADPPLEQVVAKTWEAGFRGMLYSNIAWNAGVFSGTNHDDIMFVSTGGATGNQGYFDNIGKTRRQGVELGMSGNSGKLSWGANYTYLDATYQSGFALSSPNHPDADGAGDINVKSGDKIPGLPEHSFKADTNYQFTDKFNMGLSALFNSDQYSRGDEVNEMDTIAGYAVFNLRADYQINKNFSVFARVDNLFDKEYENFGLLGEPDEVFPAFDNPQFVGVGAPRGGWIGVKLEM